MDLMARREPGLLGWLLLAPVFMAVRSRYGSDRLLKRIVTSRRMVEETLCS